MDQIKIGNFLRELRKEKGFTQEQLAESLNVSRKSVSRWETGINLPDLTILIELADFYNVNLRELIDGQKCSENHQVEDTVLRVVEYSNEDKLKINKRIHWLFVIGMLASILYMVLLYTNNADCFLGGLCLGITAGMMVVGMLITSKHASKIRNRKLKLIGKLKKGLQ